MKKKNRVKFSLAFARTLFFVFIIGFVCFLILYKIRDSNLDKAKEISDLVCVLSGNLDGVEDLKKVNGIYEFVCSQEEIILSYDPQNNKGYIKIDR